jgi:Pentapeptide repeats (8 copies)
VNQQKLNWRLPLLMTAAWIAVLVLILMGYSFQWTGFREQTLWDWLQLLLTATVTAMIAYFGQNISRQQYLGQQKVEESRAQDEVLQAYLDQIGQLLLDKDRPLRQSKEGDEVSMLARARTLTALSQLDGKRKGTLIRFLSEARLIQGRPGMNRGVRGWTQQRPIIGLTSADLSDADLSDADLTYALLAEASLRGANLRGADLSNAVLFNTDLTGATMPDGQKYEDRLKDRERRMEAGENNGTS